MTKKKVKYECMITKIREVENRVRKEFHLNDYEEKY
jgi:hypothetical protein